ncbi:MAG: type VI secretion system contractile sheath small subunit [Chitinophagaceae bacterium]
MKSFDFLKKLLAAVIPQKKEKETTSSNHQISISNNQLTTKIRINMAMYNYGVGGNEVKVDANEAINEIQHNKTMLVSHLTSDEPVQPEMVEGLKTVEDVFRYFKPNVDIEMQNANGQPVKENVKFSNLGDFTPKNITDQSKYLNTVSLQKDQYAKIMKQLKSNKVLQSMLANQETKGAMLEALKQLSQELETEA